MVGPTTESDRLVKRLTAEYLILTPIVATAILLMSEVYVTTWIPAADSTDKQEKRRIRLKYRNSPLADFEIVRGRVELTGRCERYSYYSTTDKVHTSGQDPNEHYWMHFTTISGQECILDCGRLPFGAWETVEIDIYMGRPFPCGGASPAYLQDRDRKCDSPLRYHETDRFSVLRECSLHAVPRYSLNDPTSGDTQAIGAFVDKVAGRVCSELEKELAVSWFLESPTIFGPSGEGGGFPKAPSREELEEEIRLMKFAAEVPENLSRTIPDSFAGRID